MKSRVGSELTGPGNGLKEKKRRRGFQLPFLFDDRSDNADERPPTEFGSHTLPLQELFRGLLQDGRQPPAHAERPGPV
jgi:hypothetical protein